VTDKFSDDHAVNNEFPGDEFPGDEFPGDKFPGDEFFGQFSHQSLRCDDEDGDVVVASRLQLFRNIAEHPFVGVSSQEQQATVRNRISACIHQPSELEDLPIVDSDQLREIERQFLLELQSVIDSAAGKIDLTELTPNTDLDRLADVSPNDEGSAVEDGQPEDISFEELDFPELDDQASSVTKSIPSEDQLESEFLQQIQDATSLADFDASPSGTHEPNGTHGTHGTNRTNANGENGADAGDDANLPSHEISVTINDEDHLRLQVLAAGYPLDWMWERISRVDDRFEQTLNYAYSSQWGYLSASPANVGTGMRATVLLHLPALATLGRLDAAFMALMREGIVGRGVYGEEAWGDFFRIGNQVTLGNSESGLINLVKAVVPAIVEYERAARKLLFQQYGDEIRSQTEDACRALKLPVQRSDEELLALVSTVRLGIAFGMVSDDQAHEVHSNFELTRLKQKLEVAVKMEHYASATKYRDQIRQLEQRHYGH